LALPRPLRSNQLLLVRRGGSTHDDTGKSLRPSGPLIVLVLIYGVALALLSSVPPAAVARFFGITPADAFAALVIIPCVAVIALLVVAGRKARASADP